MATKKKAKSKKEEIFGDALGKSDAELLGLNEDVTKTPTPEAVVEEVEEPIAEEKAVDDALAEIEIAQKGLEDLMVKKKEALPRCEHVDAHSNGVDGKPDGLECTRYTRHKGNHRAMHTETSLENPEETAEYEREWSDAVDLPAREQPVKGPEVPGWVAEREPTRYVQTSRE